MISTTHSFASSGRPVVRRFKEQTSSTRESHRRLLGELAGCGRSTDRYWMPGFGGVPPLYDVQVNDPRPRTWAVHVRVVPAGICWRLPTVDVRWVPHSST